MAELEHERQKGAARFMDMQVQRDAWKSLASFYRSVIMSGEGWSETCEEEWRKAERAQGLR